MERLTISLDEELGQALDALQERSGESKASLIRRALREYVRRHRRTSRPTDFDLSVWTDLLANREHLIIDVAHTRLLFEQAGEATQEFWDGLYRTGVEHGQQYRDKGFTSVGAALEYFEAANWFHLAPENERSWSLVLIEPSSKPFVATFLRGLFSVFPVKVEVIEEMVKLRVRIDQPHPMERASGERGAPVPRR